MRVAWTGHRPDLYLSPEAAREAVEGTARELLEAFSIEHFLVGGQRGVDTWAAATAHTLAVPFRVLLPLSVPEFTHHWAPDDRATLERTLGWASEVRIVGEEAAHAYTERNRLLATSADLLVAVWTRHAGGGTAETLAFAHTAGTPVREVVLDPSGSASSAQGRGR